MKKIILFLLVVAAGLVALMAVFPEDATRVAFSMERQRSGLEARALQFEEQTWHYLEGGDANAPVLLLLHGFGGDKDNWTRFAKTMVDEYRVIVPDLPGFGESARDPEGDYSLAAQSDWLHRFVQALRLNEFNIGGNSMGGHIAALYTHRYPQQVASLLLLNNAGVESPKPSETWLAVQRGESPLVLSSPADFDRLLELVAHKKPFVPWPAKGVLAQRTFEQAEFNQRIFDGYQNDRSVRLERFLADIRQPVLIIWGEYDRVLDISSIDVMRPLLPQARVVVMADTGHVPMLERPQETAAHCLDFLASL